MIILIISTVLSFLAAQSSFLGNLLTQWHNTLSSEQKRLLKEKLQLKEEQKQYNMMDNFAKYSKIQRKVNAINEKLEETNNNKNTISFKLVTKYAPQAICTILLLLLTIVYKGTPLFKLPDYIDLAPFNYLISYPNEKNYVSFHFWVMSCNVIARTIKI